LLPNPRQPRKYFDEGKIKELAEDIKENGLIEEIVVRRSVTQDGYFEIICGERRTRACRDILKWTVIPAQIRKCSDAELLRIALAENEQHQQLTPYERALAYEELRKELGGEEETTVRKLAAIVKRNKDHVQQHLNLLKAQPELQQWVLTDPEVPLRIIDELRKVEDDASRAELIDDVRKKRYNQDDIIDIVRDFRKLQTQAVSSQSKTAKTAQVKGSPEQETQDFALPITPVLPSSEGEQINEMKASSPALRVAKRKKTLAKDDKQVKGIIARHKGDSESMIEDEKALVRSYAEQWIQEIQMLLE
jgi:ParB family chromosome partitioning protein